MTQTTNLPFPYSVKRHGVTLANCDDEPVNTPGCIQDHGMLLALHPEALIVTQASENCARWAGCAVDAVLGMPLAELIGAIAVQRIRQLIATGTLDNNPTYAITTRLPGMLPEAEPLDVSVHLSLGVLIVELEPTGRDGLGDVSDRDYYSRVKKTMARLRASRSLATFYDAIAQEMRSTTGLDRVMVYRFHADESGEVVADAHRADLHGWLGLRYPASDIPKPARDIFLRIGIRPLPHAAGPLVEMVPLLDPASGRALDMTYCALRGASVMYTEYLANMGVAATLTMPILRDGALWGLIVCHHYTPTVMPYHLRAAAEFIGQIASLEIAGAESREHARYQARITETHQAILARAALHGDLTELLSAQAPAGAHLLDGIDAGGVAFWHRGQWLVAGRTPSPAQLRSLAAWSSERIAQDRHARTWFATETLSALHAPALQFSDVASGLLAVAIGGTAQGDLLLWFRPEQMQTFSWSGNPYDKPQSSGEHGSRLTPRRSFELWQEEVHGRALAWQPVEIAAALALRQALVDLVANRAEHTEQLNRDLLRSNEELDAFTYLAGHDLKEPLRGISSNARALKADLDGGLATGSVGRERVDTVLRLSARMDNLLDALLHYARVGQLTPDYDEVDLGEVVREALDMLGARLAESSVEVRIPRPMPMQCCDRIRVREIFANLIANAVKYNDKAQPWLEIGYLDTPTGTPQPVVYVVRDNGIGIESRHSERVFQIFKRLHPRDAFGGGSGAGLAIARRLVEQHHGRIWLESVPGSTTSFFFTLEAAGERRDA